MQTPAEITPRQPLTALTKGVMRALPVTSHPPLAFTAAIPRALQEVFSIAQFVDFIKHHQARFGCPCIRDDYLGADWKIVGSFTDEHYFRIKVLLPNIDSTKSTATSAVALRTSSAGLSSITSSDARRPVSAIISMHNCASR